MTRLFRNSTIRRVTEADIPWGMKIAMDRYPGRDVIHATGYIKWCLGSPNHIVLRGDFAFGVASVNMKYGFEKRARLDILAAERGNKAVLESFHIVRAMVRWAALQGAQGAFVIDSDTGVDFGPFARRLGGHEVDPAQNRRYHIPLDGGVL